MLKISRKALPGLMLILAMLMGAWTAPRIYGSGGGGEPGEKHPNVPDKVEAAKLVTGQGMLQLSGPQADVKGAQERVDAINSYQVDFSKVSNDSEFDKQFVEESLTSNSLELWTLLYSYDKVKDENLKNLIGVMIKMHTTDQQTILKLAEKLGVDTSADFVNASVYPETPDWDLGMRTENLRMDYLDPLVEKSKQSFDDQALSILEQEHTGDVQSELTAERTVANPELKAFAKHAADVTELHLQLMDVVQAVMQKYDEPPSVDFSAPYMDPHMFTVNGSSTAGSSK